MLKNLLKAAKTFAKPYLRPLEGFLDFPAEGSVISGSVTVQGWAYSSAGNIDAIKVYINDSFVGEASYGIPRPDVPHELKHVPGANVGYRLQVSLPSLRSGDCINLKISITDTSGSGLCFNRELRIGPDEYELWIAHNEPSPSELEQQLRVSKALTYRPLFSVVTPVYNPTPDLLKAAIQSVVDQTYEHLELCLVDGASPNPAVREVLVQCARSDPRVRVKLLDENLGISGNSNEAIAMAQGEFIALLDHDDTLAPSALFEVAQALNRNPNCDIVYSDHDVLSADGRKRSHPLFKPDWSPEIMLSSNYITHFTVLRAEAVRNEGGFDRGCDTAQDWDLFLKVGERGGRVVHVPKVLYHWRDTAGSTAMNSWAKPDAPAAQLRAISAHLERLGLPNPRAFFDASGFIRVAWDVECQPLVSILIPSKGANPLLESCVRSILQHTNYPSFEIVIINNGLRRPEAFPFYAEIQRDPRVRVCHYEASVFNYSSVCNLGAKQSRGDLLLFLNDDTEVISEDWLDELVMWAMRKDTGVVGAKLLKPDGTIQHAGVVIGLTGFAGHVFAGEPEAGGGVFGYTEWYRNFIAVTGACQMIRRELFDRLGGYDERFKLNGSDVELCLRVRQAGLWIVYNPFARLKHVESATHQGRIPKDDFVTSLEYYRPYLEHGDPYFNANLSLWSTSPRLRQQDEQSPQAFVQNFARAIQADRGRKML